MTDRPAPPTWSDDDLVALIQRTLAELVPERADRFTRVSMASRVEDLDVDSITIVQMVGQIEDEIGRTFLPHEVAAVRSVSDIAALIRQEPAHEG